MSEHDDRWAAGAMAAPPTRPGRAAPAPVPALAGVGHGGRRWLPQAIALAAAIAGSALAWALAALPLGLWATQGCFGGDPATGTLCPSGRYLEAGPQWYWLPGLLWATCWLLPHRGWYRTARIVLLVIVVAAAVAVPVIATWQAFAHMSTATSQ